MRFKFSAGRSGQERSVTDIPAGVVGGRMEFAASALAADAPALLRRGAWEAHDGQPGAPPSNSTLRKQGVDIPLKLMSIGHYVLSALSFK